MNRKIDKFSHFVVRVYYYAVIKLCADIYSNTFEEANPASILFDK